MLINKINITIPMTDGLNKGGVLESKFHLNRQTIPTINYRLKEGNGVYIFFQSIITDKNQTLGFWTIYFYQDLGSVITQLKKSCTKPGYERVVMIITNMLRSSKLNELLW